MAVESYQTKAGRRWRYRFQYQTPDGEIVKIQQGGFLTKSEAEVEERRVRSTGPDVGVKASPSVTVAEYAEAWLRAKQMQVGAVTANGYRDRIAKALPWIGHYKLADLQPEHLDWLYGELLTRGKVVRRPVKGGDSCPAAGITCNERSCRPENHGRLSRKTVRGVHATLYNMLQQAAERGHILRNVASLAHPPSQKQSNSSRKTKSKAWLPDEAQKFLVWVKANLEQVYLPLIMLFLTTGMRREEVLGLRWQDIDWDKRTVTVWWTQTTIKNRPVWREGAKSRAGERTIGLDALTMRVLKAWRTAQLEERMAAGPGWYHEVDLEVDRDGIIGTERLTNDFIWTNADGTPVESGKFSRNMTRWQSRALVKSIGVHGLRHTYATTALMNGADIKLVSERLGHASIAITLDTYRWVFAHEDHEVAERVAGAMLGGLDLGFDEAL